MIFLLFFLLLIHCRVPSSRNWRKKMTRKTFMTRAMRVASRRGLLSRYRLMTMYVFPSLSTRLLWRCVKKSYWCVVFKKKNKQNWGNKLTLAKSAILRRSRQDQWWWSKSRTLWKRRLSTQQQLTGLGPSLQQRRAKCRWSLRRILTQYFHARNVAGMTRKFTLFLSGSFCPVVWWVPSVCYSLLQAACGSWRDTFCSAWRQSFSLRNVFISFPTHFFVCVKHLPFFFSTLIFFLFWHEHSKPF